MKKQNKKIFYYRDLLEKHLKKKELEALLEHNDQEIPVGQATYLTLCINLLLTFLSDVGFLYLLDSDTQGCGSGFSDFVDPDTYPGARKLRNFSGKMHFLVIFNKNFTTKKV
jgi:hypothetical protein